MSDAPGHHAPTAKGLVDIDVVHAPHLESSQEFQDALLRLADGGYRIRQTRNAAAVAQDADDARPILLVLTQDEPDEWTSEAHRQFCADRRLRSRTVVASLGQHHSRQFGAIVGDLSRREHESLIAQELSALQTGLQQLPPGSLGLASVHDQAAAHDSLGFAPYVDTLAEFLTNAESKPPFVVSIEGEWGSGKSSFANQLAAELVRSCKGDIKIVRINPWQLEKGEAIWASVGIELHRQLERALPGLSSRWARRIELGYRRFDWQAGWFDFGRAALATGALLATAAYAIHPFGLTSAGHGAQGIAGAISAALAYGGLKKAREVLGSPLRIDLKKHQTNPDYEEKTPFLSRFQDDVAKVLATYAKGNARVFIFVDDIDRCDPARCADVMQSINLMIGDGSSPLVWVLAMDRERVAAAIGLQNERQMAPAQQSAAEFGHAFLEKFVQLPMRVPTADSQLVGRWVSRLNESEQTKVSTAFKAPEPHPNAPQTIETVVRMVARALDNNPRRIKHFLNIFRVRVSLAHRLHLFDHEEARDGFRPLTLPKLAKLVAAELRWPKFVSDLAADPELLPSLLLEGGESVGSPAYTHWSGKTALIDLLQATVDATPESETTVLDVDVARFLRLGTPRATRLKVTSSTATPESALLDYAQEYEKIRRHERSSDQRTQKLDRLFRDVARLRPKLAWSTEKIRQLFDRNSAGERFAALALLADGVDDQSVSILLQIVRSPRSPFEHYHALRVALANRDRLSDDSRADLALAVSSAVMDAATRLTERDSSRWAFALHIVAAA